MITHRVAGAPLDFAALREALAVPGDFASEVLSDAQRAAQSAPLPDHDATDVPFVTIDPPGSKDLDQAVHIARDGEGYLVSYAIADVASFVTPAGALDEETQRRGETLYFPDTRVPLHPTVLSEDAASLLPGQIRPAVLWRMRLAADASVVDVDVRRARVRSTAQLDYAGVQNDLGTDRLPPAITLLEEVGTRRLALARARHAINLDLPAQEVEPDPSGHWHIVAREPLPVENYNAEISLLTGTCAAAIMLEHGTGILRTVPAPDPHAVDTLRKAARALGVDWPADAQPGDVIATLDRSDPHHVALIEHATVLLRGAAYTPFRDAAPAVRDHAGIGAPYAHVTAPLRRLVDRYGTEICLAAKAGQPVPGWVLDRLDTLPQTMQAADHRAHEADRAVVDMTEAWLLRDRVGEQFSALVLESDERSATVTLDDPVVRARCDGANLPAGEQITVRLTAADPATRTVRFHAVEDRDTIRA